MSRRLDRPSAMDAERITLPSFSNLTQHEGVEWHKNTSSSSTGQSTPSSSLLESAHYEQCKRTFRGMSRTQYDAPQTYPPPRSQRYNRHDYIFCPGEEPPATAPLQGVRIENQVDTGVRHEYDRDHRATDHYALYNEETRVDWHCHEPTTSARWSPGRTSPDSSRRLPIRPQAPATQTTRVSATSTSSGPSPIQHKRRNGDWLHRRPTTSPPPFPTHSSQNTSASGHLPVRHQVLPTETTDFSFPPPSSWASSSSYGVQRSSTASPPRHFEVDESHYSYHHPRSHALYHQTQTFREALPQPPIGSRNTCAHPNESSLRPSPSDRNNGREDRNETGAYDGFGGARTPADNRLVDTPGTEIGRRSQDDTAQPSAVASVVDTGAKTKRPAANPSRATSSRTTTTTRPGTAEPTTGAVVVDIGATKKKAIVEGVEDPEGKSKQQNLRRSTKGMKRGSLLMEWKGPEPPVPLPPIKSWGRARQSTKAKTGTSKAWRVDVNAAPRVETEPEAGSYDGSTPKIWDTPRGPSDYAESVKSSTKMRKGDHDGQPTSIGSTEEESRAGGSQSQGTQRPRPKPRKKQKTSSPATEIAHETSGSSGTAVRYCSRSASNQVLQQGRIVERDPTQRLSDTSARVCRTLSPI
ncbi:hypothetical protein BDN71DRAFT_1095641 [Pleurotus eryngii]|uniref:Uncharacterized protein n=1 Tax=Pleurotus eryngii TaxID=5323 RepID=A0A9P5ZW68_PLEER|nr:hypothetical protein BDN71DRAFT_1095641 [Pleurotus eryngii]